MTHHKFSALLNSLKYVRIAQNLSYKPPTFKKWYIGVFAELLRWHSDPSFATD